MKWKPRKEVPFALALVALAVLPANAGGNGSWDDAGNPEEKARLVGVKIRLREVCQEKEGYRVFGKGGRSGRLVIVSQEPAPVSSTIIERCDGTIDTLDGATMQKENEQHGQAGGSLHTGYYRPWLYRYYNDTLYSYRTGKTGSYDVGRSHFAGSASFHQSRAVANHVSGAVSGGRATAIPGGRAGFFSGGGRGGA